MSILLLLVGPVIYMRNDCDSAHGRPAQWDSQGSSRWCLSSPQTQIIEKGIFRQALNWVNDFHLFLQHNAQCDNAWTVDKIDIWSPFYHTVSWLVKVEKIDIWSPF